MQTIVQGETTLAQPSIHSNLPSHAPFDKQSISSQNAAGEDKTFDSSSKDNKEAIANQKLQENTFENVFTDNLAASTLLISKVVKGIQEKFSNY
jgi:outer membrane protein W